jgi:hypothetical protein
MRVKQFFETVAKDFWQGLIYGVLMGALGVELIMAVLKIILR